jgi:Mg-chelatase subunit ChlD
MNIEMMPDGIDPEIDVRLTAMVLGEASDFEAAQLLELMSERPELAAWYKQLQHLHGELHQWALLEQHLAETTADEKIVEAGPWMLSPDKRASVLAILGHGEVETPQQVSRLPIWQKITNYRPKRRDLWIAVSVAASLVMVCSVLMLNQLASQQMALRNRNWTDATIAPDRFYDRAHVAAESTAPSTEFPSAYYLDDGVQYFPPTSEMKSSLESARSGGSAQAPVAGRADSPSNSAAFGNDLSTVQRPSGPPTASSAPGPSTGLPSAGLPSASSPSASLPSGPVSDGTTRLYATPYRANDFEQTVTPRIVIAEKADELSQVAVPGVAAPGGGNVLLGGVAVQPTLPPAPVVAAAPSDSKGIAEADNSLGLTTEPTDKFRVLGSGETSERMLTENETLRQQVDFSESRLAGEQAGQKASSEGLVESKESRLNRRGEAQLEQRFGSNDFDGTRGYLGDESKSNTPAKPGSPARDGILDNVQSLAEQKPQGEFEMADPFGADVPAKRSSEGVAQEKQSWALGKSPAEDDFGTMPGMNQNGFGGSMAGRMDVGMGGGMGSGMGGMGGMGGGMDGGRGSERGRQNSGDPQATPELLLKDSLATHDANTLWDEANKEVRPDIALMNPDTPLMDAEGRQLEDLAVTDRKKQKNEVKDEWSRVDLDVDGLEGKPAEIAAQGKANLNFRFRVQEFNKKSEARKEGEAQLFFGLGREEDVRAKALDDGVVAGKKLDLRRKLQEQVKPSPGLNETLAETERFSTFSLHVSDVSFKLALDSLAKGQWPEAAKIRLEEFLNAFDYQDPLPSEEEKVACRVEQAIHPFLMQRNVLRVAMRTSAVGRNSNTPLRLTLLLDNSGSMQRADRAQTVRRAFETLAQQLTPADQVTLITFANEPKLRADRVNGSEILNFVNILENSPVEGGTNLEAALRVALEKSIEAKTAGAQSRVILMTDGAVNLGDADPSNLSQLVLKMRDQGIAFDAAGISAQDLNDEVLEALTRQGDGRYYLLDNAEQVDAGFSQQIAGALRPSAKNVKVQVEFNPQRVRSYKLLGFEKHVLNKEDFRNDKVDAAELAAAEAGVALYHYEVLPDGVGDVGSVSVRFQDMTTGMMVEKRWPIAYESTPSRLDQAPSSLKLATASVLFAAHLKGEPLGENVDLKVIAETLGSLETPYSNVERVQQLRQMVESARQIAGASSGNR